MAWEIRRQKPLKRLPERSDSLSEVRNSQVKPTRFRVPDVCIVRGPEPEEPVLIVDPERQKIYRSEAGRRTEVVRIEADLFTVGREILFPPHSNATS